MIHFLYDHFIEPHESSRFDLLLLVDSKDLANISVPFAQQVDNCGLRWRLGNGTSYFINNLICRGLVVRNADFNCPFYYVQLAKAAYPILHTFGRLVTSRRKVSRYAFYIRIHQNV